MEATSHNNGRKRGFGASIDGLLGNPIYNFASLALTLASILTLCAPVLLELSAELREFLLGLDLAILSLFAVESALRIAARSRRRYIYSFQFLVDAIVIAPLLYRAILAILDSQGVLSHGTTLALVEFPGLLLIKGVRILRLLGAVQFFYLQKQMGLAGERVVASAIKSRIFSGAATMLFFMILAAGVAIAYVTHSLAETQKKNLRQQIELTASQYGVLQARLLFEESIISVQTMQDGERRTLRNDNFPSQEDIKDNYKYGEDYVQLDSFGPGASLQPGESVQISYRAINRRADYVELAILVVGVFVVATLLFSLNYYLEKLILGPLGRARTVVELRIKGEELEWSDIPQMPATEITNYINAVDFLYQRMRAPARRFFPPYETPRREPPTGA